MIFLHVLHHSGLKIKSVFIQAETGKSGESIKRAGICYSEIQIPFTYFHMKMRIDMAFE